MNITPEELRRHYENLSDEGLLEIDADDLTDVARECLEDELESRGLLSDAVEDALPGDEVAATPDEEMVAACTYTDPNEARLAFALLRSAGIPSTLDAPRSSVLGDAPGIQLLVPVSLLEQANEVLASELSDEELAAQAEAAGEVEEHDEEES